MRSDFTSPTMLESTGQKPPSKVKVYGERNTGTNYLSSLLAANLRVRLLRGTVPRSVGRMSAQIDGLATRMGVPHTATGERIKDLWFSTTFNANLGWKHMLVRSPAEISSYTIASDTLFVVLVKNPYSWLLSLHRRPYHLRVDWNQSLAQFATASVSSVGRENAPGGFASPIDMWNNKVRSYLHLADSHRTIIVRYEDLLDSPRHIVETIAAATGQSGRPQAFINIAESTKGDKDRGFEWYREYYLGETWKNELDDATTRAVEGSLDLELVESLAYGEEAPT